MAATIATSQARAEFTSNLVDVFNDMMEPTGFLRSFFPSVQEYTRYLSIQVMRNLELVAVDVLRGQDANRNKFSKSTDKQIDPPYYHEEFDLTDLDLYDRLFGSTAVDAGIYSQMIQQAAMKLNELRNKIERAYEVQCSQVLETGVITLVNGDNIDFRRKAGSKVDKGAGNYWATNTIDPFADLTAGAVFLRTVGKAQGSTFNALLGATALNDLMNNSIFKGRVTQNLTNSIDSINAPQRNAVGAAYHGTLTAGAFRINLWTYPQYYDTVSGSTVTANAYVNPKVVTLLPEAPRFKIGFAAVPQLLKTGITESTDAMLPALQASPYVIGEYLDMRKTAHIIDVKSAGVAIPTAIDQMYTVKVVA